MIDNDLIDRLLEVVHDEQLARYQANCDEVPHQIYKRHENRIDRLVAVCADGDEELAMVFGEALHDMTHDGVKWQRDAFYRIARELEEKRADAAMSSRWDEDVHAPEHRAGWTMLGYLKVNTDRKEK